MKSVTAVLCGVLGVIAVVRVQSLNLNKVHLVDYLADTGNMLFRGDMPCNDTAFDWDNLIDYMRQRVSESGLNFPGSFYVVDISLNNIFDMNPLETEFWSNPTHASLGTFLNWPIGFAGILPPAFWALSVAEQMSISQVWGVDQLPDRVALVRQTLVTNADVPRLVYVHCTAGCDRTGEFIGSYRMLYQHANTTDMYALDTSECGRSPNWFGTSGLEWFCLHLQETNGTQPEPAPDCETFATCELFGHCHPATNVPADWLAQKQADNTAVIVTGRQPGLRRRIEEQLARLLPGGKLEASVELIRLMRGEIPESEMRFVWERMLAKLHAQP